MHISAPIPPNPMEELEKNKKRAEEKMRARELMGKVVQKEGKALYQCEECGFKYEDKEWAKKCEVWCREHKSCNLEIIKHGMPPEKT